MKVTLRDDLARALLSRFRAEEPRPNIHVSDLANPCLRRAYYSKKGLAPATDEDLLLWLAGRAHHELMEGKLREIQLERDGITGTIDCLDNDTESRVVAEFKTTRASSTKDVVGEYPWWLEQVMSYLRLFGDTRARLYVLFLMGNWKPPTEPQLKVYELTFTEKEIADNWAEMCRRRDTLVGSLNSSDPPLGPRQGMEWVCERCSVRERCSEDLTKQLW